MNKRVVTPLARLCGLENEYVLRTSPARGFPHPTTRHVFTVLGDVLGRRVAAVRAAGDESATGWFTENGGRVYLERIVEDWGLVECATPECRGPFEGLLYQAAQEKMLLDIRAPLEESLVGTGWPCSVEFVRNAKDADGNLYGPQESYDVDVARGPALWLYRAFLPPIAVMALFTLAIGVTVLVGLGLLRAGAAAFATIIDRVLRTRLRARLEALDAAIDQWTTANARTLTVLLTKPLFGPLIAVSAVPEKLAHRSAIAALLPFLASRPIVCGTGSLDADGAFQLSERAPSVDRVQMSLWFDLSTTLTQMSALYADDRRSAPRAARGLAKNKALMHAAMQIFTFDFRPWRALFQRRQRLELTSSDANRAQAAELLKIGTTMLVLDMHEAGVLKDAPRLRDPVGALRAVSADPTLTVQVPLTDGRTLSALELQRWYCTRAAGWLQQHPTPSLEAKRIVELWADVLDKLATDPKQLVGVLDWPTKKMLLETAGKDLGLDERRKIDIRYHELGSGYFERFVESNLARTFIDPDDADAAVRRPPQDTPAALRGRLIRDAQALSQPILEVGWDHVLLRDRTTGKKKLVLLRGGKS